MSAVGSMVGVVPNMMCTAGVVLPSLAAGFTSCVSNASNYVGTFGQRINGCDSDRVSQCLSAPYWMRSMRSRSNFPLHKAIATAAGLATTALSADLFAASEPMGDLGPVTDYEVSSKDMGLILIPALLGAIVFLGLLGNILQLRSRKTKPQETQTFVKQGGEAISSDVPALSSRRLAGVSVPGLSVKEDGQTDNPPLPVGVRVQDVNIPGPARLPIDLGSDGGRKA